MFKWRSRSLISPRKDHEFPTNFTILNITIVLGQENEHDTRKP